MFNKYITIDEDVTYVNGQWSEANMCATEAWRIYMDIGKKLKELKEGRLNGRFMEWCEQNLEFGYTWVNVLIRAYSRYELSGFTDKPQENLKLYAKETTEDDDLHLGVTDELEPETDIMKKQPKENSVKVQSKINETIKKNST